MAATPRGRSRRRCDQYRLGWRAAGGQLPEGAAGTRRRAAGLRTHRGWRACGRRRARGDDRERADEIGLASLGIAPAPTRHRRCLAGAGAGLLRAYPARGEATRASAPGHGLDDRGRLGAEHCRGGAEGIRRAGVRFQPDDGFAVGAARTDHPFREAGLGGPACRGRGARDRQSARRYPGLRRHSALRSCRQGRSTPG